MITVDTKRLYTTISYHYFSSPLIITIIYHQF